MREKAAATRTYMGVACNRGCGIGWDTPGLVPRYSLTDMVVGYRRGHGQRGGGEKRPPVPGPWCLEPGKKWIEGPAYLL